MKAAWKEMKKCSPHKHSLGTNYRTMRQLIIDNHKNISKHSCCSCCWLNQTNGQQVKVSSGRQAVRISCNNQQQQQMIESEASSNSISDSPAPANEVRDIIARKKRSALCCWQEVNIAHAENRSSQARRH